MYSFKNLIAGIAGASALTIVHQLLKNKVSDAPRMDLLGMQSIAKATNLPFAGMKHSREAYALTMAGDIVANGFYYSLPAFVKPKHVLRNSIVLGVVAGAGAVLVPRVTGLNSQYSSRSARTVFMTIGIYTLGGLVTGSINNYLQMRQK